MERHCCEGQPKAAASRTLPILLWLPLSSVLRPLCWVWWSDRHSGCWEACLPYLYTFLVLSCFVILIHGGT